MHDACGAKKYVHVFTRSSVEDPRDVYSNQRSKRHLFLRWRERQSKQNLTLRTRSAFILFQSFIKSHFRAIRKQKFGTRCELRERIIWRDFPATLPREVLRKHEC